MSNWNTIEGFNEVMRVEIEKVLYEPKVGDFVKPDGWYIGECLKPSDGFSDSGFPGCQFRLPAGIDYKLAVNIRITGRKVRYSSGFPRYRCEIEFVGDCEPSTFARGWIYPKDS